VIRNEYLFLLRVIGCRHIKTLHPYLSIIKSHWRKSDYLSSQWIDFGKSRFKGTLPYVRLKCTIRTRDYFMVTRTERKWMINWNECKDFGECVTTRTRKNYRIKVDNIRAENSGHSTTSSSTTRILHPQKVGDKFAGIEEGFTPTPRATQIILPFTKIEYLKMWRWRPPLTRLWIVEGPFVSEPEKNSAFQSPYWIFTSNVDGHFIKSGFPRELVVSE